MNRIASAVLGFIIIVLGCSLLRAQVVPQIINYQGRVLAGTTNFDGSGSFKFAIVNAAGTTTYWSNDGTSNNGGEPTAAVSLTVSKGLYSVLLGDSSIANMTAIPNSVFNNSDVRLRVWFNDGTHGSQLLSPDQRIAAVGYAMVASTVPDGTITAALIAPNAVTASSIALPLALEGENSQGAVLSVTDAEVDEHTTSPGTHSAISGISQTGFGVSGLSNSGFGVRGVSVTGTGVNGSGDQVGVSGDTLNSTGGTGVVGTGSGANGKGVSGTISGANGTGVVGTSSGSHGIGVRGLDTSGAYAVGVAGSSMAGTGLFAVSGYSDPTATPPPPVGSYGVFGSSIVPSGTGVYGEANFGALPFGVWGRSTAGTGVFGVNGSSFTEPTGKNGVEGQSHNSSGAGVYGHNESGPMAIGVSGSSVTGTGVFGASGPGVPPPTGIAAVHGANTKSGGYGVYGEANMGSAPVGVYGKTTSSGGDGVRGEATMSGGHGVYGIAPSGGISVVGLNTAGSGGLAGSFMGAVVVTGMLSKGGGTFRIDHPLDPANKYLSHSFVESPDMMNIYNGNVTTDVNGNATIVMPDYFEALNRDFRYQLTVIGQFAQAIVATEMRDRQFTIKTDKPNVKVSWQVTGIRQDAFANAHRVAVEEEKVGAERGAYLHPELFGQPPMKGIGANLTGPDEDLGPVVSK